MDEYLMHLEELKLRSEEAKQIYALFRDRKYQESLNACESILATYRDDHYALYLKALCLQMLGREKDALRVLDHMIDLNVNDQGAYKKKLSILLSLKQYSQALKIHRILVHFNPNDYIYEYERGNTLLKLERYKEALNAYDRAIKMNIYIPELYKAKGHVLIQLERFEEAVSAYEMALDYTLDHSKDWKIYEILEQLYKDVGREAEAKEAHHTWFMLGADATKEYFDTLKARPQH